MTAHPIHLHRVFFHSLQGMCSLCSSSKGLSTDTLHIRHCNGQPGPWCSLRQARWQGWHGPLVLGTMPSSNLVTCCLWPTVSKAVSPKYLFPAPHPAQQFSLPLQKELLNAEVAHLHRVAMEAVVWVSHPAPRNLAVEELLIFLLPTCHAD